MKTLVKLAIIYIFIHGFHFVNAQCVQCDPNSNPSGNYSSVGGMSANAVGQASLAVGLNTTADGNYSIALGKYVTSYGASSVTIGRYLQTNTSPAFIIGTGADGTSYLQNNISNSLMIGFGSNKPTLFVGGAMTNGLTGEIGIGDVTDPQAKLHIKADNGYTTEVLVQWSNNNMANLWLGTAAYGLKASTNKLEFKIPTGGKYIFNDGNLGIGTAIPTEKLEVAGNIKLTTGYAITSKVQAIDNKGLSLTGTGGTGITIANDGKVGIGTITALTEKLEVNGNIKQAAGYKMNTQEIRALDANGLKLFNSAGNGIVINTMGNVGIGTPATSNRLEVSGTVQATSFVGIGTQLENVRDYRWNSGYSDYIYTNGSVIIGVSNYTEAESDDITITNPQFEVRSATEVNRKSANFIDSDGKRIFLVTNLTGYGYNPISSDNDAGIFWNDGQFPPGQNLNAGFVIGPHRDGTPKGIKIDKDGNVGIGKAVPTVKLDVNGDINANVITATNLNIATFEVGTMTVIDKLWAGEIEVTDLSGWKDCVFESSYKLMSLKETEEFIRLNKHLPGIPSEKEVMENGINVGEMNALLLQKIEELTLYMIELEKEIIILKDNK